MTDLKSEIRGFLKYAGFSTVAGMTLELSIDASTAVYGVVYVVLPP